MSATPRVNAAQWRQQTEGALGGLQGQADALRAAAERHGERLGDIESVGTDKGEQAAWLIGQMRGRTSANKAAVDDLRAQVESIRAQADELVDPERFKARVAAAMLGAEMNGVDPVVGVQNGIERGLFDNVWRFNEDWRPTATDFMGKAQERIRDIPLGGVVRAMAENVGVRQSAALKAERIGAATLAGAGTAALALSLLQTPQTPGTLPIQQVYY
jgi:hypothetical protein